MQNPLRRLVATIKNLVYRLFGEDPGTARLHAESQRSMEEVNELIAELNANIDELQFQNEVLQEMKKGE